MISAAGIKVYSYLNIIAVADFFMEIKPHCPWARKSSSPLTL